MGSETSKGNSRRRFDPLFHRVFQGVGIDIGCGDDNLNRHNLFPAILNCEGFDKGEGDAQRILDFRSPESYDFVYSSHCLEHLPDPKRAITDWFALVKPGGFMVIVVPDEDLYEQGGWPSIHNSDHKCTFSIKKSSSWSPVSMNLVDLVAENLVDCTILRVQLCDDGYNYLLRGSDQSSGRAETSIELVVQKNDPDRFDLLGRLDLDYLLATGSIPGNPENLSHRLPTMRRTVELLHEIRPKILVETGIQSSLLLHSQGMSTTIWAEAARRHGATLFSIDCDAQAVASAKSLLRHYRNIEFCVADAVQWLESFGCQIDFLYLDSLGFYDHNKQQAREYALCELKAAFPRLSRDAVVLLDDANVQMWFPQSLDERDAQGRTLLAHQFLIEQNAECVMDFPHYQRLYRVRK